VKVLGTRIVGKPDEIDQTRALRQSSRSELWPAPSNVGPAGLAHKT